MNGSGTNPTAGLVMLAALIYMIYWMVRSRRRWRTILYALLSIAVMVSVCALFAWIFPSGAEAIGTLAGNFFLIVAAAVTAGHARSTLRSNQKQKKNATDSSNIPGARTLNGVVFERASNLGPITIHGTGQVESLKDNPEK